MQNLNQYYPLIVFIILNFFSNISFSQGVAINTTGSAAHSSSMLDISSSSKGILIPRLSTAQRNSIISPASGLTIFNTDCNNFNFFNGTTWIPFPNGSGVVPAMPGGISGPLNFCTGQNAVSYNINPVNGADTYNWTVPFDAVLSTVSDTAIVVTFGANPGNICVSATGACGTSNQNCISVLLDTYPVISSQTSDMTICSGYDASFSVNTTGSGLVFQWQEYFGSWNNLSNGVIFSGVNTGTLSIIGATSALNGRQFRCQISSACGSVFSNPSTLTVDSPPTAPNPGTQSETQTQITWNWGAVSGAIGYKWNTVNNFSTATDLSNTLSKTETGLVCGTSFTRYVWAYNYCGYSSVTILTQNTSACVFVCGSPFTVTHIVGNVAPVTKTVTYGTVVVNISGTNKCMITQNLGADNQATSVHDATEPSAGWYWQYNRKQGYKNDGTSTTPVWNSIVVNGGSWSPANDPCTLLLGAGWRLPTDNEWSVLDNWSNSTDAYNSQLKLHNGGFLDSYSGGSLLGRGISGLFWSSDQWNIANGKDFLITNTEAVNDLERKEFGMTLRCIKD